MYAKFTRIKSLAATTSVPYCGEYGGSCRYSLIFSALDASMLDIRRPAPTALDVRRKRAAGGASLRISIGAGDSHDSMIPTRDAQPTEQQ